MNVDFNSIDTERQFTMYDKMYDKGPYKIRIKSIEEVQAQSGNDQLRIKTEILSEPYEGKQLTDHVTLVDSCDWKLGKFIQACGVDIKTLGTIDTKSGQFRNLLNKLIGKTSVWVVDQQTGRDGNLRNVVVDYQPDPNASTSEEDTPEFLKGEIAGEKWDE